jgi:peroxiredoxin Q/BCP
MEAKGFNDRFGAFQAAGYEVIGVSTDLAEKNAEFRAECGLDYRLVSDEDKSLVGELDLLKEYGEHGSFARRVTFVLDADGVVQHAWEVTEPGEHPAEVLAAVTS